jgi:homospermidine synthase
MNKDIKQLVFIGFGMVAKTLLTLMHKDKNYLLEKPILIIEPTNILTSEIISTLFSFKYLSKNTYTSGESVWLEQKITKTNYKHIFDTFISNNSIVIDLAFRVDTKSLIQECDKKQCLYVNTAIDEWDPVMLSDIKLNLMKHTSSMTAVLNSGQNPGLVSHYMKFLIKRLSIDWNDQQALHYCHNHQYNLAAEQLGIRLIQISERDTQKSHLVTTEDIFYNTWSVVGLLDEAMDSTAVAWGSHEKDIPTNSYFDKLGQLILPTLGYQVRTRSYEPRGGVLSGYCIPHAESYSLLQFLKTETYSPTIYYSYLLPDNGKLITNYLEYALDKHGLPKQYHILRSDEIYEGYDSVGCLVYFDNNKTYWIGSIIDNTFALSISPEINATCIQVAISVLATMMWMIKNPHKGIIEPEVLDTDEILDFCIPWLGDIFYSQVDFPHKGDTFKDLVLSPSNLFDTQ